MSALIPSGSLIPSMRTGLRPLARKCNGWVYYKNATGAPVIGRLYARMKLAGVDLSLAAPQVYLPDFSHLS